MSKKKIDFNTLLKLDIKDVKKHLQGQKIETQTTKEPKVRAKRRKKTKAMTQEVVVFDIGSTVIQGGVGRYQKNRLAIKQTFETVMPYNCIEDGKILDEKRLASVLASTLIKHKIKTKRAIITMNSSQIINRDLFIPQVEADELETVIRYELQQYLPINLDEYQIRYITSDEINEQGQQRVFVSAFPERMLRSYYQVLHQANLHPYALELPLISIRKLIHFGQRTQKTQRLQPEETIAFLDLGHETMNIMVYHEGQIDFTRLIRSGGQMLDEALRREGITNDKLHEYKAYILDVQAPVLSEQHPDFKQKLDLMLSEVEKFMQFYHNSNQDKKISKIFTYGGCAQMKGMGDYVSDSLKIPAEIIQGTDQLDLPIDFKSEQKLASYFNAVSSLVRVEE